MNRQHLFIVAATRIAELRRAAALSHRLHALGHPAPLTLLRAAALLAVTFIILYLGAKQAQDKITLVKPIAYIGHADEASYALQGRSIAEGHTTRINYVSTFFIPYPRDIIHREDHWPPFMGYSIAPFFYAMGVQPWVARLPGILYGSIGLPLATALLAFALSRRGYVALIAALLMMASPEIYLHSMRTLSDVANAMLVAGFLGCVFLTPKHPWLHIPAGLLLACAYFSKGSEILLFALYPLLTVLAGGFPALARRHFYAGLAAALLCMTPAWYANWRDYGNPFHTTQNYVAAFFGFDDWEAEFYAPYWGKNLPRVSDRWQKHADYWTFSRSQIPLVARAGLSGAIDRPDGVFGSKDVWSDFGDYGLNTRAWLGGERTPAADSPKRRSSPRKNPPPPPVKPIAAWQAPVAEVTTLAALALLAIALLATPLAAGLSLARWLRPNRAAQHAEIKSAETPDFIGPPPPGPAKTKTDSPFWMLGPILGTGLVVIVHLAFIAYFWKFEARFCFPVVPLLLALGCTALSRLVEWPAALLGFAARFALRRLPKRGATSKWSSISARIRAFGPATFTLFAAVAALVFAVPVRAAQEKILNQNHDIRHYPFSDGHSRAIAMGSWIRHNLPDAVIMCRGPWELLFYAATTNKAVGLPAPRAMDQQGADQIFAIARYYHVTYFFADATRPSLYPYLDGRKPGLTRVPNAPGPLYKLDWSHLPTKTVHNLWP